MTFKHLYRRSAQNTRVRAPVQYDTYRNGPITLYYYYDYTGTRASSREPCLRRYNRVFY